MFGSGRLAGIRSNTYTIIVLGVGRIPGGTLRGLRSARVRLLYLSITGVNMPVRATTQQAVEKWLTNIAASQDRMKTGAMAVTTAPGASAAAAADKWLAKVTAAKDKFKANVGRVSLADWQNSYVEVGIPRVAQGATAKQAKFASFFDEFLPYLQRGLTTIDKMPSTTLEDGIARATAMIRYNAKFKRGA